MQRCNFVQIQCPHVRRAAILPGPFETCNHRRKNATKLRSERRSSTPEKPLILFLFVLELYGPSESEVVRNGPPPFPGERSPVGNGIPFKRTVQRYYAFWQSQPPKNP